MADRVVLMNSGRIEQAADPITLYERPANLFVAGFIGTPSMNFLHADVLRVDAEGAQFRLPDHSVMTVPAAALRHDLALHAGRSIIVGVRPDDTSEGECGITLTVDAIEPLGPHTLAIGRVGETKFVAKLEAHSRPPIGAQLPIALDWPKMHFFDAETGKAIA